MTIRENQAATMDRREEKFSEAKRRLLEQRLHGRALRTEIDPIRPRPAGAKVPLSAEQRRVWFHASQQLNLPVYNEPLTIRRHGSFDLQIFEASFNEVLRRHEAWRTSFSPEGEQVIHDNLRVTFSLLDLSALAETEREVEALRIATEDAKQPILIHSVPLFRARVLRMTPNEHRIYLTLHHIIFDGVSINSIFLPELSAIYDSLECGNPSPLPPPSLQYGDYAIWRERQINSPELKQHLAYWRSHLSGELPVLRLPGDRQRPAIASNRGSMECFDVPDELMENLRRFSREQGVTLYMTLLAAFKVLLFRYSGQNDLIVGSASDARRRPELETVMGYILDTFAIRTRPSVDLRFSEYLAKTRDAVLAGLVAADVPFDRVVMEINPKRHAGSHPIFDVFFSVRPPMSRFSKGWDLAQMDLNLGISKFVLHLELAERPEGMEARFLYSTDTWDASAIKRMAANWLVLLRSACNAPDESLGSLAILTPEETAALLEIGGWNDTTNPYPQAPFNALFEEQVLLTPNAVAASFGNDCWTYKQLNYRADVLASSLRAAGVSRGSVVAIVLDRSLDLLAALIAVQKAGAAYLPIDIRMPVERVTIYLSDANPSAIITQRSLMQLVSSHPSAILLVDEDGDHKDLFAIDSTAAMPSSTPNDLDDTAYLIYTSGTTGEPKAVEISQRSLVNLLASMRTAPGFGSHDVLLAATPISFDIATLELFLPLICGGAVAIASRDEALDPQLLAEAIRRSRCTVMQATPATWRTLLNSGWKNARQNTAGNSSKALRILCGGESLPGELANRLLAAGVELWNMYGPTETTIWSLIHRVKPGIESESGPVSVGHPIGNTTAFVLDSQWQPLPIGVQGELFLGGVGLAKGYRGQPRLTADRFVTVKSVGNLRLYRTGDLAVRRADGTIELLGRSDNQVKIRGYRVELEAVEAAVLRHPGVAAAAARVWPESTGEFRLSIYVVPTGELPPNLAEMRAFLGNSLPEYMIPSDLVAMTAIPLTPHGKVDRAHLPVPIASKILPQQTVHSSVEGLRLSKIWEDLLGCKNFGLDDNFFDLGGHSLLLAAMQQRIAKEFDQSLSIAELFQNSTLRQLAQLMQGKTKGALVLPSGVLALQPNGTRNRIFWIHSLNINLAKPIGENQPLFSVSLTADDFPSLGERPCLQVIAKCLLNKILATQPSGPYNVGGFCLGGIIAYEIACQLRAAGHEVSLLVQVDAPTPAYLQAPHNLARKLSYLHYVMKRSTRVPLRTSWENLRLDLRKRLGYTEGPKSARTEIEMGQKMVEAALLEYQLDKYDGEVLVILAADHPRTATFLPEWQAVISRKLQPQYVQGQHRDLLSHANLRIIAEAIVSRLKFGCAEEPLSPCTDPSVPNVLYPPASHGLADQSKAAELAT
jgi:amino acid adenylation domain-containing protein